MTRDDILRLANECGFGVATEVAHNLDMLRRFAALVAAHEREACAKVCEDLAKAVSNDNGIAIENRQLCAEAIRARGEK